MSGFFLWAVRGCAWLSGGAAAVCCVLSLGAWGTGDLLGRVALWGGVAAGAAVVRTALVTALDAREARARALDAWGGERERETGRKPRLRPGTAGPGSGDLWVRTREAAVWLLTALMSAALLVALFQQHHREAEPELRRAGAEVATAVVAGEPTGVHAHTSEGRVLGWTARLELTVPGAGAGAGAGARAGAGAQRVRASAYTYREPKAGDRVQLLWAPSEPALEGRVDERKDLRSVTGPASWDAFPQADEARKASLLAAFLTLFLLVAGLGGTAMTDTDGLRALPWSGRAQLCWTGSLLLAFALHLPALYGHPHPVGGAVAWVSFLLPALGRGAAYAVVRSLS
ncbi:hypothetical protein ACFYYB_09810 [Streptomyces sp. NPDC002886]|uniref:hypothetical protein n=1 Tax=Streptomyces sp. NPDC002886 TaxID=3364667 RepID=UPI0036748AD5